GQPSLERLRDWVRNYVGFEFDWDVQLVLARDEVPGILLGREGELGWTTWLGTRRVGPRAGAAGFGSAGGGAAWLGTRGAGTAADDLTLAPERTRPHPTTLAAA